MADANILELLGQEKNLIKSTPVDGTLEKLAKMRVVSVRAGTDNKISWTATKALAYVVEYLKISHSLSDAQIKELRSEDLNRMPEIIYAHQGGKVLFFGWIPVFGWFWAIRYILFKSRVKYLRSLDENIFDTLNINSAISYYYRILS